MKAIQDHDELQKAHMKIDVLEAKCKQLTELLQSKEILLKEAL